MTSQLIVRKGLYQTDGEQSVNIEPGQSIGEIIGARVGCYKPGPNQPAIAVLNGGVVDSAYWDTKEVKPGDRLLICPRPFGTELLLAGVLIAAVAVAATASAAIPPTQNYRDMPEASPTYDLQVQTNMARLGQPVTFACGKTRTYPDLVTEGYRYFKDNDRYLRMIFGLGHGEHQLSEKRVGLTPFENIGGIRDAVYKPGEKVTLFPADVITSDEAVNIDLHAPNDDEYSGRTPAYRAAPLGEKVRRIEYDIVAPRGLYYMDKQNGDLHTVSATVQPRYRLLDDAGNVTGGWVYATASTVRGKTNTPQRRTFGFDIPDANCEVDFVRSSDSDRPDTTNHVDSVQLGEMRAELDTDETYEEFVWAVEMKVDDKVSSLVDRKFNCMDQVLLPIWNGTDWSAPQVTRNPVWAFCEAVKSPHGGRGSDSQLNLVELKQLADTYDARGDYFDYRFDTQSTLWPALKMIAKVGRAHPTLVEGVYSMVRDEPKVIADYSYAMGSILPGSFEMKYRMDQWQDDSVEIEYVDAVTWKPDYIPCAVPGSPGLRPLKVKLEGCTDRTQAYREGMFLAGKLWYRNREASYKTGLDGGLPFYGSHVEPYYSWPAWATSGQVLEVQADPNDANRQLLTLSEPVTFEQGETHKISLISGSAKPQGPFVVLPTAFDNVVSIDSSHNAELYVGFNKRKTQFAFGSDTQLSRRFVVQSVAHAGNEQFTIKAELDDDRCHQFDAMIDSGSLPVPSPTITMPALLDQVRGLQVNYGNNPEAPELLLTWNPVQGAERYIIQISSDDRATWDHFATTHDLYLKQLIARGSYSLRIAAAADEVGPWFTVDITPGDTANKPSTPSGLALVAPWEGVSFDLTWTEQDDANKYLVQFCKPDGSVRRAVEADAPPFNYTAKDAEVDGLGRDIKVRLWAKSILGEYSPTPIELDIHNDQVGALGSISITPLTRIAEVVIDQPTDADFIGFRVWRGATSGFVADDSSIFIALTSDKVFGLPLSADTQYFRFAGVDAYGADSLTVSAAYRVDRQLITETDIQPGGITTPTLAANAVTADKMFIGELSSIVAYLGQVYGGLFATSALPGDVRFEADSGGDFPIWWGVGEKLVANGHGFYDKTTQAFVLQDPASGMRLEIAPGQTMPFWLGTGAKTAANAAMYYSTTASKFYINNAEILGELEASSIKAGSVDIIDTLMLQGQAVTISSQAFSSGNITISSNTVVQTLTFTSTGNPVSIDAACVCPSLAVLGQIRLYRNGSLIHTVGETNSYKHFLSMMYKDNPPAGSVTYQLRATKGSGSSGSTQVSDRVLRALEVKR